MGSIELLNNKEPENFVQRGEAYLRRANSYKLLFKTAHYSSSKLKEGYRVAAISDGDEAERLFEKAGFDPGKGSVQALRDLLN